MESWRSPLASIPPFSAGRWEDAAQCRGGWWNRQPLKLQLVSKRKRLILQWENQTGYEKNLESTPRQVFQQAGVPGQGRFSRSSGPWLADCAWFPDAVIHSLAASRTAHKIRSGAW